MNTPRVNRDRESELHTMLSPTLRREIAANEETATAPQGTVLVRRGVPQKQLVTVNSGTVEIKLADVREIISVDSASCGKVFGMEAVLLSEPPDIDVTCVGPCHVTFLPAGIFLDLLQAHPEVYSAAARVLASDIQIANRILRNRSLCSSSQPRLRLVKSRRTSPFAEDASCASTPKPADA